MGKYKQRREEIQSSKSVFRVPSSRHDLTQDQIHRSLPDLNMVDEPVRIGESCRIIRNIGTASAGQGSARSASPHASCPVAAESGVENDVLLCKECAEVTAASGKSGQGSPPRGNIDGIVRDVCGHGTTRPEPDVNAGGCPLHGIYPASIGIESRPVVFRAGGRNPTACVPACRVAVCGQRGSTCLRIRVAYGAACCGVKSDGVCCLCIYTFDDIDFTTVRPIYTRISKVPFV